MTCPPDTQWIPETDNCRDKVGGDVSPIEDTRFPNISNPIEADRILGPDPVVTSENDFVCPVE